MVEDAAFLHCLPRVAEDEDEGEEEELEPEQAAGRAAAGAAPAPKAKRRRSVSFTEVTVLHHEAALDASKLPRCALALVTRHALRLTLERASVPQ